nr:transposase family protein [Nostoc sp. ChiQUE01b]
MNIANADARKEKMASIFREIEDPRVERSRVHVLTDILIIGILSAIAGGKGWEALVST